MLPSTLRQIKHLAWGKVLLKPLQYLRDLIFEDYANGATCGAYSNGTAYLVGDRVKYIDRAVYECVVSTLGNLPTDTYYWKKVNNNFIGVRERIRYNSQKTIFEYSINKWFQTTGIYVSNTGVQSNSFVMGNTGPYSSTLYNISRNATNVLTNGYIVPSANDFTIYVPSAFYNGLGNSKENIIRSFADKYVLAGITYNITQY